MMTDTTAERPGKRKASHLLTPWLGIAVLLAIPFGAMQFTAEVNWGAGDFVLMGIMLGSVVGAWQLATRTRADRQYRIGLALFLSSAILLVWANLAVGIVGSEDRPVNLLFHLPVAVGVITAVGTRFTPRGMMAACLAMAVLQGGIALGLLVTGTAMVLPVTMVLGALWLYAARLFQMAARRG